jgi:hypothetical protein
MISEPAPLNNETIPFRQQIFGILAAMFLAGVLLFRFNLPPHAWRRIDASMTIEDLQTKLGEPFVSTANEIRWREKRLLGEWRLTVHLDKESGKTFQNHFRFFGQKGE